MHTGNHLDWKHTTITSPA